MGPAIRRVQSDGKAAGERVDLPLGAGARRGDRRRGRQTKVAFRRTNQRSTGARRGTLAQPEHFMNAIIRAVIACVIVMAATPSRATAAPPPAPTTQLSIDRVDLMPNHPEPFKLKDFKPIARGLDKVVFDFDQKGKWLPLIWWDDTKYNVPLRGFGFPSYVGRPNQTKGHEHESITTMGALLGATIAGIDKSKDP